MARTQHRRMRPAEHDDQSAQGARLRRAALRLVRPGDGTLQQAGTIDGLVQSKRRTWEIFVRWLMIGGLLGALALIALLLFVYSGHPYQG